jgi:hypothetical protein
VKYGPAEEQSLTPEIPGFALELGLENAFIQTLESQEHYLPDFDKSAPFTDRWRAEIDPPSQTGARAFP